MEFGIFSQMYVPPGDAERERFLREVDVAIAVDAAGFKYDWPPLRSVETFGQRVLPRFDRDPVHRTTRLHEGALAARAA